MADALPFAHWAISEMDGDDALRHGWPTCARHWETILPPGETPMKPLRLLLGAGLVCLCVLPVGAGTSAKDYLTDEGKLKETLEIRDVQGGFAGFTGTAWKVEPDGQWGQYAVFQQKLTLKDKGQLSK